jgi:hypothetical protein
MLLVAPDFRLPDPLLVVPDPLLVAFPVPFPVWLPKAPSPPSTAVGVGTVTLLVVERPLGDADAVADPEVEEADMPRDTAFNPLYD